MPALSDDTILLIEGRRLAYTEWGTPDGSPLLYFPGTPGSRLWCPDERATLSAGVRLIMPDRPGVGRSDVSEGRTLSDWPADVVGLADALGIDRFAVVGVSAGGPYAASCAALIPERLTAVGIVSSRPIARSNWTERPEAYSEWTAEDQAEFDLAQKDPESAADLAAAHFATQAADLEQHPEQIRERLESAEGDRWVFADEARTATFDAYIRETFRQGLHALRWELIDVFLPWGFSAVGHSDCRAPLARRTGSMGDPSRRRLHGEHDSRLHAHRLARCRPPRVRQALGRDPADADLKSGSPIDRSGSPSSTRGICSYRRRRDACSVEADGYGSPARPRSGHSRP
jgi:pimeloyl-ACP methyl ester carboxylesterase